jgi:hypothetical protein
MTRRNHKFARSEADHTKPPLGTFHRTCHHHSSFAVLPRLALCNREGGSKRAGLLLETKMSSPINFQSDAMECLRMAEQAKVQDERALLVDLARAWILLGEQLNHWNQENNSDLPKPNPLN